MSGHRLERVNEDAKRILALIIRELKDPRIPELTTVTSVNITPDFKFAKVYVSFMADDDEVKEAIKALNAAAGFVRREFGKRIEIRYIPKIHFAFDESISQGAYINKLINDINKGGHNG